MRTELNEEEKLWLAENNEYINQDHVNRHWREVLANELNEPVFKMLAETTTISDADTEDQHDIEELLAQYLEPIEVVCLMQFYIEKLTRIEIAEKLSVAYYFEENRISQSSFDVTQVKYILEKSKEKLKTALKKLSTFSINREK